MLQHKGKEKKGNAYFSILLTVFVESSCKILSYNCIASS